MKSALWIDTFFVEDEALLNWRALHMAVHTTLNMFASKRSLFLMIFGLDECLDEWYKIVWDAQGIFHSHFCFCMNNEVWFHFGVAETRTLDVRWNKTSDVTVMCLHEWQNERMNNEQVSEWHEWLSGQVRGKEHT